MKEAAGEANMTVITIVLIAIVLGVGTVVVNRLMTSNQRQACCASLGGTRNGNVCTVNGNRQTMSNTWVTTNCPES